MKSSDPMRPNTGQSLHGATLLRLIQKKSVESNQIEMLERTSVDRPSFVVLKLLSHFIARRCCNEASRQWLARLDFECCMWISALQW